MGNKEITFSSVRIINGKSVKIEFEFLNDEIKDLVIDYIENKHNLYFNFICKYAQKWALDIQYLLLCGNSFNQAVSKTEFKRYSPLIDLTEDYLKAVELLGNIWKHGKKLKRWYNAQYNYKGEGLADPRLQKSWLAQDELDR